MKENCINPKPNIVWLEGILDYFNAPFPHEPGDPREIGFGVGRQIVGLYLVEMLLKHALDDLNKPYERNRNLRVLFGDLPESLRCDVETKHEELLSAEISEAFDFTGSVDSFLEYLGDNPANDSRYFWERSRPSGTSIVFFANSLRTLIYALFIVLHGYPEGRPLEKHYDTKFIPFEDSLENKEEPSDPDMERSGKRIGASIFWLEGLLSYFTVAFPHEPKDPRRLGFQVGQRMTGLYLAEMLLKYAIDDLGRPFGRDHNLYSLFKKLPRPRRRALGRRYDKVLQNRVSSTWDYASTVESLLEYSGDDSLTETRYFWEYGDRPIPLSPEPITPLIYALFLELHNYPHGGPMQKRYETVFLPFEESLKRSTESSQGKTQRRRS